MNPEMKLKKMEEVDETKLTRKLFVLPPKELKDEMPWLNATTNIIVVLKNMSGTFSMSQFSMFLLKFKFHRRTSIPYVQALSLQTKL